MQWPDMGTIKFVCCDCLEQIDVSVLIAFTATDSKVYDLNTLALNCTVRVPAHSCPPLLQGGDTLGLQVTKERELIYYVNGESVGVAASNIPEAVYGFVDLSGGLNFTVKLIPDIQEVRGQNHNAVNHYI